MAFSPLRSKALHHGRSLSLPSKLSHPSTSHYEENLSAVKSSESTSSSSLSSLNNKLDGLKNLYYNLDDLLLLPRIQQIVSQQPQEKWIDRVLEGHISLLDASITAKDLFSQMKQCVQELLSSLRRKDANGVKCYLTSRKKSKKLIQKSLKDLKSSKSKHNAGLSLEINDETMNLVCMLKETESVTFSLLESLLSYMMQERKSGRSFVSKMMKSKKVSDQVEELDLNEFKKVDDLLEMNQENKLMNHLKEMDSSIQVLEENLECFSRQLIKTRVCLLNVLNH